VRIEQATTGIRALLRAVGRKRWPVTPFGKNTHAALVVLQQAAKSLATDDVAAEQGGQQ